MKTNFKSSLIALVMATVLALPAFAAGEPGNVTNVVVKAKDAETITISWNAVKDGEGNPVDHYKIYYGPSSVQKSEVAQYEVEVETPTNATTYDIGDLLTNTTYYVSVTGVDKNDLESAEYSIEASGKPGLEGVTVMDAEDKIAPTVLNVIAADKNHVLVGFSEKVALPELLPETAFVITEQVNPEKLLEVSSAKTYAEDVTGKTVLLETEDQTANVNYIMTAGASVKDEAGNAIESGNTDSGVFLGSDTVSSMALNTEAGTHAAATETTTPEDLLLDSTTPTSTTTATTPTTTTTDTTAPEDIRNLMLTFRKQLEKFVVVMNWEASLNTAQDLMDQMVYMSTDLGATFDTGRSIGATAKNYEMANLEGGKEYTFKVTEKDESGNESVGVVQSIRLPQTGFGAGFLVLTSAFGAHKFLKRRKQKLTQTM